MAIFAMIVIFLGVVILFVIGAVALGIGKKKNDNVTTSKPEENLIERLVHKSQATDSVQSKAKDTRQSVFDALEEVQKRAILIGDTESQKIVDNLYTKLLGCNTRIAKPLPQSQSVASTPQVVDNPPVTVNL